MFAACPPGGSQSPLQISGRQRPRIRTRLSSAGSDRAAPSTSLGFAEAEGPLGDSRLAVHAGFGDRPTSGPGGLDDLGQVTLERLPGVGVKSPCQSLQADCATAKCAAWASPFPDFSEPFLPFRSREHPSDEAVVRV